MCVGGGGGEGGGKEGKGVFLVGGEGALNQFTRAKPYPELWCRYKIQIQSNLVISNSLISNNRLSRSENLVPVLT